MLAREFAARRLERRAEPEAALLASAGDSTLDALELRRRALAGDARMVARLLDASYDPTLAAAALGVLTDPSVALSPESAAAAELVLRELERRIDGGAGPWARAEDAMLDALTALDVVCAPPSIATRVAALRAREAGGSETQDVRRTQQILRIVHTLTAGTSASMLRAQAEQAGALPLSAAVMPVVAAHLAPLGRLTADESDIAASLLGNLLRWQSAIPEQRRAWAKLRADAKSVVHPTEAPQLEDVLHAREEVLALVAAVETASRSEPFDLPQPLSLDRSFSDLAAVAVERLLPWWWGVPAVAVPMLELVATSRTARPFIAALAQENLPRRELDARTTRALVHLAARFLTGLTKSEAWLQTEGITRKVDDAVGAAALDEIDGLLEADDALRSALWSFADDPSRDGDARAAATLAVLSGASTDRLERLRHALARDLPCQRAALAWVIEAQEYDAFDVLRAWSPPGELRPSWYRALAATGQSGVVEVLGPLVARQDHEAERAMVAAGIQLATEQARLRRDVLSRAQRYPTLRRTLEGAAQAERVALGEASRAAQAHARAQARAASLAFDVRAVAAQAAAVSARFQVELAPLLQEASLLVRRVQSTEHRLAEVAHELERFSSELQDAAEAGERCRLAIEAERARQRELGAREQELGRSIGSARQRVRSAEGEVRAAESRAESAERAVERADTPEAVTRARREAERAASRAHEASRRAADLARRVEELESELEDVREALGRSRDNLRGLNDEATRLAGTVRDLRQGLRDAERRAAAVRADVEALRRALRELAEQIARVRSAAAAAARSRDEELASVERDLGRELGRADAAQREEAQALERAGAARDRKAALLDEIQQLTRQDAAAVESHERLTKPAAEELAQREVDAARRSIETLARLRARQHLALGADLLFALLRSLDGFSRVVRPIARRLGATEEGR